MSTSILDRTLASTTSSSSKPSSTPLLAPPSTLAVSSSLQYFYHCLTPDTLILPQQLLYPFPHCRHRHYHRHQLQFQMMFDHQSKQLNMSNTSCMQSNLVETQLEEIIHLCRAMSLQQNRSPLQSTFGHDHTPPNKSCDNCRLARRYSADCVRYLLDESCETVPDNGKECSFGGIAPENVDSTSNKNGCCANMVEHTLNPHQMSSGNNVSNSGGIVTELVAKFEEKLLPKSSLEETQPNSKHLNSSPFVDQSPDDVNVTSKVSPVGRNATPLTFDTADDNIIKQCAKILNGSGGGVHTSPGDADNRRSIGGKRFKPVPVPPPKPEYLAKMVKCSSMEASKAHSVERSVEQQHNNITESRQHHNCCCCCHCSNNLLGIDLSTSINNKCDKHNGSHRKSAKKCDATEILAPEIVVSSKKCLKRKSTPVKCLSNSDHPNETDSPPPPINNSSSDNSSSDEGIENPAILEDDEELDELVTQGLTDDIDTLCSTNVRAQSQHSHHQHHFNHHSLNHSHYHHQQSNSRNLSSSLSSGTTSTEFETVERYLNGTDYKHLATLKDEESLLLREIFDLEREQPGIVKKSDSDEEVDEELLEFQRIEREIKLSELRKCLQIIQKQIENFKRKLDLDELEETRKQLEEFDKVHRNSQLNQFTNMTDSMIEECRLDAAQQINLDSEQSNEESAAKTAPLAEPEMDSMSQVVNFEEIKEIETKTETDNKTVCLQENEQKQSAKLILSDTESDDEALKIDDSKVSKTEKEDFLENLDDLLHESIEESLKMVNRVSELEQETFVVQDKPLASSIIRRESQYENERDHQCENEHFGYRNIDMLMLKSVYNKFNCENEPVNHTMNQSTGDVDEMLESATTNTEDTDDTSFVLRRCSGRFPTDEDETKHSIDDINYDNDSSTPIIRKRAGKTQNKNVPLSQRPLTLYMPSQNEELNLITHLHALGHDLTSSIVTNHLLITPFTCSGYLYKQCNGSAVKWRKRYFHFNRVRKVFVYFHDRTSFEKRHHPKRGVFFDEIQDVYVDHTRISKQKFFSPTTSSSSSSKSLHHHSTRHSSHNISSSSLSNSTKSDGTRCVFVVSTTTINRKFTLSTYVPELMRIWMDVIFTGAQAYLQDLVEE